MDDQIKKELSELRDAIVYLAKTSDYPRPEQLSYEAINKATGEYIRLTKLRDKWIAESELYDIFDTCHGNIGSFIRHEFEFSNYYKQGREYFYNRNDLLALAKELKVRNVNLPRYMKLKSEEEQFVKKVVATEKVKVGSKKKKTFKVSDAIFNINSTDFPFPSVDLIKEDIEVLMRKYKEQNLSEYIDIYQGNFAMVKYDYDLEKYVSDKVTRVCKKWCDNFNYANTALKIINEHNK